MSNPDTVEAGMASERIVAAAYLFGGITMHVPPPGRHHTILHRLHDLEPSAQLGIRALPEFSGFVTDAGRFVDRREGWGIAEKAGQIIRDCSVPGTLYSENMW